ncbi:ABC transporter ATP-binding protein [Haliangium ochraceum]|uniref:ABC transporter related protein n=1 Tax=Haliangium ochraceum (strain DSM 14365 / JCM 11303 / SMP-2) TaxID=502025 RepID=D0LJQ4_HALO1|nr:ABC transporter ATP-binding protein [Haliangium ochraceum]ACY18411.1 ABC transporter related protein [Haliangium ochraceum DSM 14365]
MSLKLEGIGKTVGGEMHLADIDLTLEAGSFNILVGPTLAGKTTLLRLLAGLDHPSAGRMSINGRDITRTSVRKRSVAMVYQQFVNYPSLSVFDNIASPLKLQRNAKDQIDERVHALAKALHIEALLERLPAELSGGQQQRVAIARALAKDAELLLLDEPLVNLDYKLREELREELRGLLASRNTTVVYATTEPKEAMILGGDTVLMHQGRVLQHAPTGEVYRRPTNQIAARLFSDPPMNLLAADIEDGRARLSGGAVLPLHEHLAELPAGPCVFGIHAADCRLHHRKSSPLPGADAGAGYLDGEVELVEIAGSETFVYVHIAGRSVDEPLVVRMAGVYPYEPGMPVQVELELARVLAFADAAPDPEAGVSGAGALIAAPR